ncbi:MAG: hypothetical protein U1A23_01730 [Candidatus Sungbacteria bacterium]|nr:hypothetical protein [bacterium]MDZ4285627.1 hypothetical protein [Candidatus Sungbacteria bacterium]
MPVLYYAPIIHSIEDFGSLGEKIKDSFFSRYVFDQHQHEVNKFWLLVQQRIDAAIPNPTGLIIYQDGIPVEDQEEVLALFGVFLSRSPNYQLVKKLIGQGAVLKGTEDRALVREQAAIHMSILKATSAIEKNNMIRASGQRILELTHLRDIFIAQRIRATLTGASRGVLFLGRNHDILPELEKLPDEYTIICL